MVMELPDTSELIELSSNDDKPQEEPTEDHIEDPEMGEADEEQDIEDAGLAVSGDAWVVVLNQMRSLKIILTQAVI